MGDSANALGPNEWLVDEMYEQYLADPKSVSASWQEFFEDYRRDQHEPVATTAAPAAAPKAVAPEKAADDPTRGTTGAAGRRRPRGCSR